MFISRSRCHRGRNITLDLPILSLALKIVYDSSAVESRRITARSSWLLSTQNTFKCAPNSTEDLTSIAFPFQLFVSWVVLQFFFGPSVLWHCWLGDRKGIQPVKSWVSVCWWWWFDWSFARLMAPVVTIGLLPSSLAPVNRLTQVYVEKWQLKRRERASPYACCWKEWLILLTTPCQKKVNHYYFYVNFGKRVVIFKFHKSSVISAYPFCSLSLSVLTAIFQVDLG